MISKTKAILIAALFALIPVHAFATDTWLSGETHFYYRIGATGGGMALDAISGVSMGANDVAVAFDVSGVTVAFYTVSTTGNESGTTTESIPDWIMPNSAGEGEAELAGVSMWKLTGVEGVTGFFKTLIINGTRWDDGSGGLIAAVVQNALLSGTLDLANLHLQTGVTLPSAANPTPTAAAQIAYNTGHEFISIGDGTNTRAVLTGVTKTFRISSPDLIDDPNSIDMWSNDLGTTFWVTTAFFMVDTENSSPVAGVTLDVVTGASEYGLDAANAGVSALWTGVVLDESGCSSYLKSFTGVTGIPPGIPVLLDFGDGSTAGVLRITLGGYLEGNAP